MIGFRAWRSGIAALLLFLAPVFAPGAQAKVVAKGTPYAAEVILKVKGEAHVREHRYSKSLVCSDEPHYRETTDNTDVGGAYEATYKHVTVPLGDESDFGRAYKRLHVAPTATSPGTGAFLGNYVISGSGPPTNDQEDCGSKDYFNQGTLGGSGKALFLQARVAHGSTEFGRFVLTPVLEAAPDMWSDAAGASARVLDRLTSTLTEVPEPKGSAPDAGWSTFGNTFDVDTLRPLIKHKSVTLPTIQRSGTADCGSDSDDVSTVVCELTYSFKYTPVLKLRLLHRTKRAYRY